jgi:hypothetical protein
MTRQAFDALVHHIEKRYAGRQTALERATTMWVGLGLAGLLAWLLFVTGIGLLLFIVGAIAEPPLGIVLICIGVPVTLYGILQAYYILQVELAPPEGHLVSAGEAPALSSMLEGLSRELQCRLFDEVRITIDLNAGVRELPRLGLLGWPRTILEIGLPLARAMSSEELKAILAHEFVHLSARHGRSGSRLYRLNRTWGNVFENMQKPAGDSFTRTMRSAIARFVDWYWPRLHARALVLSRAQEFQADREAAAIAGKPAMVSALWRLEALNPWLSEHFWPELLASAAETPLPPSDIVERLTRAMQTPPEPEVAALRVERGLVRATLHDETHPALLDRVRPLGVTADDLRRIGFPIPAQPSAAEVLLGDVVTTIVRELSEKWHKDNLGLWRDRHRRAASEARRKAAAAEPATLENALSADIHALWESARETVNLQGPAAAVPQLKCVLERDRNHDGAAVILGRHLAVAGDPEGEAMLARVVARNDEIWMPRACEALQEVYRASGRMELLREIQARLDRHESDLRGAQRERSTITAGDTFVAHELAEMQLAALRELLASIPAVGAAWLLRKTLKYFPNRQMFVLCVRGTATHWWSRNTDQEHALVRQLVPKVELPGQVFIISRQGSFRGLARRCMKFPGSEVFRRVDINQ